jgi:hypothetical protein
MHARARGRGRWYDPRMQHFGLLTREFLRPFETYFSMPDKSVGIYDDPAKGMASYDPQVRVLCVCCVCVSMCVCVCMCVRCVRVGDARERTHRRRLFCPPPPRAVVHAAPRRGAPAAAAAALEVAQAVRRVPRVAALPAVVQRARGGARPRARARSSNSSSSSSSSNGSSALHPRQPWERPRLTWSRAQETTQRLRGVTRALRMTTSAAVLLQQAGLTDFSRGAASPVVSPVPDAPALAAAAAVVMPPPAGGGSGGGGGPKPHGGGAALKRLSAADVARHEASVVAFHARIVAAIASERASGREDGPLLAAMQAHLEAVEAAMPRHLRIVAPPPPTS